MRKNGLMTFQDPSSMLQNTIPLGLRLLMTIVTAGSAREDQRLAALETRVLDLPLEAKSLQGRLRLTRDNA